MSFGALVDYYERELAHLRRAGRDFAARYPRIAQHLALEDSGSADPHVERLLEGVAFLTARIQRRLDDDFPELSDALLGVLQPHLLCPIPSIAMLQVVLDPTRFRAATAHQIPRHSLLYAKPAGGVQCRFSTCYALELWPLEVSGARVLTPNPAWGAPSELGGVLELTLGTCGGAILRELMVSRLSFFLHAPEQMGFTLYEYILHQVRWVQLFDAAEPTLVLHEGPAARLLSPVGFDLLEGLLPYDERSGLGQRLMLEFFAFPQKFLFFQLLELDRAVPRLKGQTLGIRLFAEQPLTLPTNALDATCFRLGVTPVVNLFTRKAEILYTRRQQTEYLVRPDKYQKNHIDVYDVVRVRGFSDARSEPRDYHPFYSITHEGMHSRLGRAYWHVRRQERVDSPDHATDLTLSFTDLDFSPSAPSSEVLEVEVRCTNRDFPSELGFGILKDELTLEGQPIKHTVTLVKPTPMRRFGHGRMLHWRLVSQLSLNFSSLQDPQKGLEMLREALRLLDCLGTQASAQQVNGLKGLECKAVLTRLSVPDGQSFLAHGFDVTLVLDPAGFVGSSPLLFASVLERFLGLYVATNTFVRLSLKLVGRVGTVRCWPARAGTQVLL